MRKYAVLLGVLVFLVALIIGCNGGSGGEVAKDGDTVRVHYTGTLADGTVFDSSEDREPLEFVIGADSVIPGFEEAVKGMKVDETKTVVIPAEDAYGPYREELLVLLGWEQIPEGLDPQVGQTLLVQAPDGSQLYLPVVAVSEEGVTIDTNHQLAGKDLTFKITLVELEKAG